METYNRKGTVMDCTTDTEHMCPECSEGKHRNCDGFAWCFELDAPARCTCGEH